MIAWRVRRRWPGRPCSRRARGCFDRRLDAADIGQVYMGAVIAHECNYQEIQGDNVPMSADTKSTIPARALGAADGETIWFLHNRMTIKATAATTGGAYGLFETWVAPGFSPPLHVHHREDESFWILEGEFTMRCGDRTFRGGTGAYFFLPRGVPHTFVNEGSAPG